MQVHPIEQNGKANCLYQSIRFDDFDVTWAGPNPFRHGFCFGSDDGRLRFTDEEGKIIGEPFPQVASREAINGVAFHEDCLAVSTRAEVTLFVMNDGHAKSVTTAVISVGAHNIVATDSGYFIAPCGMSGLMLLKAEPNKAEVVDAHSLTDRSICFYAAIALPNTREGEVLVFAIRQGGVGIMPFSGKIERQDMSTAHFSNQDIVDLCPLDPEGNSSAFAAAARNGTLHLFRNALSDREPATIKFNAVQGTVYGIASCRGHLFVLTNKAMYVLAHLAERFVNGKAVNGVTTQIRTVPMDGVDLGSIGSKYVLVVTGDAVLRFDIDAIEKSMPANTAAECPELNGPPLLPVWNRSGIMGETRSLVGVA